MGTCERINSEILVVLTVDKQRADETCGPQSSNTSAAPAV